MLEIKDLVVAVEAKKFLHGVNLSFKPVKPTALFAPTAAERPPF